MFQPFRVYYKPAQKCFSVFFEKTDKRTFAIVLYNIFHIECALCFKYFSTFQLKPKNHTL